MQCQLDWYSGRLERGFRWEYMTPSRRLKPYLSTSTRSCNLVCKSCHRHDQDLAHFFIFSSSNNQEDMAVLVRIVLVLMATLHIRGIMGIPVPFHDVEEAWKQGRSERDIHDAELATPSFFHEARSDGTLQGKVTGYMQAFDNALDERSMAARKVARGGLSVVATVQNFMDTKILEWMRAGELAQRDDEAPVLRPRRGRRWNI
ncbi:hypothetical protein BDV97DRAFT_56602 [Delphinella strobiligena]|nr:hypothetical protein BDV97DRAFT_56602 [Delphinella strobiligena]